MEFRLLSDHEDVATFLSSLHRSHRESTVVALLIRGLTIRFLFKEKPRRCRLVATEA